MPIEITEVKTKSGHPVLRTNFVHEVTLADVEQYHQRTPAGRYDGWGYLVTGNVTSVSSEVKKKLANRQRPGNAKQPVAIVLDSALMRMAASLVTRLTGSGDSETFRTEAEGLAWLDGQLGKKK